MPKCIGALLPAFLGLLFIAAQAHAAEVIKTYHSDIDLAKSGELTIAETITVNVEGDQINHGIYRDFPLTFEDATGRIREVDFDLLSVERNGKPEPYHTESIPNGIRIYAGSADVWVDSGIQVYRFTYKTGRQIDLWDDRDELYWNVTGNGWIFPIEKATATITLPDGASVIDVSLYTGAQGATGKNARSAVAGNQVIVETTRPLAAYEGLTVSVTMPQGTVDEPTDADLRRWWWRDNRNLILGLVGAILVWGWYGWSWSKVGRDPPRGIVVPRWDAPHGLSPALIKYVDAKGFGSGQWEAFSAACINLAVKGLITLEDLDSVVTMRAVPGAKGDGLPPGEAVIFENVRKKSEGFRIAKSNGKSVQTLGGDFVTAIEKEHRGKYYQFNASYVVAGIALSVIAFASIFIFGRFSDDAIGMIIFPNFLAIFIGIFAGVFGRGLSNASLAKKGLTIVIFAIVGLFILGIVGLLFAATFDTLYATGELPAVLAMCSIVVANIIFFFIMGAPTPLGSKIMDEIAGLRLYLTLAEKDRMNMQGAPKMSPKHFETLLPYAVALGVEKPWNEAFEKWLADARLSEPYQPLWYSGHGYDSFSRGISHISSSMASTAVSSLPAPPPSSSSGSFGGGSSGGGGGGGGGGGW
ncbi:DUF2207 domain-containing protein [Rhizobium sp. L1K21]|uniref:DUF2207 domain-containing protein n=1 Tax=Rhizobium sp. L1K21 TaxID=2954933 RepID=UPI0035938897